MDVALSANELSSHQSCAMITATAKGSDGTQPSPPRIFVNPHYRYPYLGDSALYQLKAQTVGNSISLPFRSYPSEKPFYQGSAGR